MKVAVPKDSWAAVAIAAQDNTGVTRIEVRSHPTRKTWDLRFDVAVPGDVIKVAIKHDRL